MGKHWPVVTVLIVLLGVAGGFVFHAGTELSQARADASAATTRAMAAKEELATARDQIDGLRADLGQARLELEVRMGRDIPDQRRYGPRIAIAANSGFFVDQVLRDDEEVSGDLLGAYLARVVFNSTTNLAIKADHANPDWAIVKARFELWLVDLRMKTTVLKLEFDELRLSRSKSNQRHWLLTGEGIALIEQAWANKK